MVAIKRETTESPSLLNYLILRVVVTMIKKPLSTSDGAAVFVSGLDGFRCEPDPLKLEKSEVLKQVIVNVPPEGTDPVFRRI